MDENYDSSNSKVEEMTSDMTVGSAIVTPSPSKQLSETEQLWNQFSQPQTHPINIRGKYPNPDVPEFYPRSMKIVCEMSHETGDSSSANETTRTSTCTTVDTLDLDIANKNEMFLTRTTEQRSDVQRTFIQAPESLHGVTHYYWSYHNPKLPTLNRPLKGQTRNTMKILKAGATCEVPEPPGENEASTVHSLQELRLQVQTKNQQLVHMNNVVKALLEEICKINELLMRNRVREQENIDIHSSTEHYLMMVGQLGYPCVDCCARLREFISHLSKQLERKIVKEHSEYRSNFVDCILSVIESSLHKLTSCSHIDDHAEEKPKVDKQDAWTQTNNSILHYNNSKHTSSRANPRRSKQQVTKVYRNRNYYKCDGENAPATNSHWTHSILRGKRMWQASAAASYPQSRRTSTNIRLASSLSDADRSKNPIQLVHQRFKNLNCRLEGIPEKKLVKFSYIVDNIEYSAIASTKKEAQYICAWHMLNACNE